MGENKTGLICPFCGTEAVLWETGFGVVQVVECKGCQTRFVMPWHRTGEALNSFWNMGEKDSSPVCSLAQNDNGEEPKHGGV